MAFNLDGAVGDFANLDFKQAADEIRMASREDDLRTAGRIVHGDDIGAQAVADAVFLGNNPLARGHRSLKLSQIQDDVGFFKAADCSAYDFAGAILELLVDHVLFDLPDALVDRLAGGLGGDAPEIPRRHLDLDLLSGLDAGLDCSSFGNENLVVRVLNPLGGN